MSLPRYPECKPAGVEELDQIPSHWGMPPLYLRYKVELGKMLDAGRITGESLLPYLRNVDVQWGRINLDSLPEMDVRPDELERYTIRQGDLLVCEGGEVGRAAIVEKVLGLTAFQKALHRLRPVNDGDVPKYMFYVLRWASDAGLFSSGGQSTISHLTAEQLRKYRFPCPSKSEQLAISEFLDRETSKLDELIIEQEALAEVLVEKRHAVISHAINRGLDHGVSLKDSGILWLGRMPAHWQVTRLKFVADVQTGIAKGKDMAGKNVIVVPYLRVANVQDGFLALEDIASMEIEFDQLSRYRLCSGDVLMNEGGDFDKLGRGAIWRGEIADCIHQNHVFAVRPRGVSAEWLNQITNTRYAQFYFMGRAKQSTNLASISSTNIMELPVLLPPAEEQAEILAFIDVETRKIDALKESAEQAIGLLKERRAALISAAVTGKIDVRGLA